MWINKFKKSNRENDYNPISTNKNRIIFFVRRGNFLAYACDRFIWNYLAKIFYVVGFPTHVDIELSVTCQMDCMMCLRKSMPTERKHGLMSVDLYKKIIDECSLNNVYSVKLSWRGEPLLHPDIIKMVAYAKESGIKDVAFLTNVERLNPYLIEGLITAGLDWISCSVDGSGETYEKIRKPAKYRETVDKIKQFQIIRNQKGRNKPLIRIQTIYAAVKDNPDDFFTLWESIADKVYIIADQVRGDEVDFPKNTRYFCYEPWRRLTIGWNGVVSQCICDYNEENILGNVNDNTLHEIWHNKQMNELRTSIKRGNIFVNKPCKKCHDPGVIIKKEIMINGRKKIINLYQGQEITIGTD